MNSKDYVYNTIANSRNLPTLPEILVKLLEACEDEERPLSDIAAIIGKDPILSFKVLQLVNSSYYSLAYRFTNVEQAVIYLGANSIKSIAVTTAVHQVFEHKQYKNIKHFSMKKFWWHSLLCATLSKRIARKLDFSDLDVAYLSGLLHDIGRLVLISAFPVQYQPILAETENSENRLWAEIQLIGAPHSEVGAWLIREWRLPSLMADAIQYHHEDQEQVVESFSLIKIVYLSNLLSHRYQKGSGLEACETMLNLSDCDILEIMEGANDEVAEIAASLKISIDPSELRRESGCNLFQDASKEQEESEENPAAPELTATPSSSDQEPEAQQNLTELIRRSSLLTVFLENLVKTKESEQVIRAFEQCIHILFDINKVLFFLPDEQNILLKGETSSSNRYYRMSRDLTMPLHHSMSRIVQACHEKEPVYLTSRNESINLADRQVLNVLESQTVLLVPISVHNKPGGIILLGLPDTTSTLMKNDCRLIKVIAQHVGLSLHLGRIKAQKASEIEAERVAAISMTAKKFAHEINNPLGIISNYLTTLKLKFSEEKDLQENLEIINEEIQRISTMVNQLDLTSRNPPQDLQKVDINGVLEDIIQLIKTSIFSNSGPILSFHPEMSLPPVRTSRDAIKQIIINLVKNAAEAMQISGIIEISTAIVAANSSKNKTDGIEIVVSDNGPGLPVKVRENLYKPFVTTKGMDHSGLGLSIVDKTIKDLGGSLSCISEQGKGTSFTIFLPLEIS